MQRRFIEESFPVKEVGIESSGERHSGHISSIHLWWARRPLASSRATIYASLVDSNPKNTKEYEDKKRTIIELSKWENSLNFNLLEKIHKEIKTCNNGLPPKVLDPFGGGASIPLESLRLGCETYSGDYNPVAILIQKCTLEFPQKYGNSVKNNDFISEHVDNRLIKDIKKWSDWILQKSLTEIEKFYPNEGDGFVSIGYIVAKTIICENPTCRVQIPLMKQYWLSLKHNRKIAVFPIVVGKTITFKIVGDGYQPIPKGFDPNQGSISKATTTCISCKSMIDNKSLKNIFRNKKFFDKQIVLITCKKKTTGKKYRVVNNNDELLFQNAVKYLNKKQQELSNKFGIDPVPDEIISTPDNKEYSPGGLLYNFAPCCLYGFTKWRDLFNPRQLLSLIVFSEKIKLAHQLMLEEHYDAEYAKVITTYLAIILDRLIDRSSNLTYYHVRNESIEHVFGRQALQMTWNYPELNPCVGWSNMTDWILKGVDHCSGIKNTITKITQESASNLSYADNYFDAVFTDPPYYDNIPYSVLSDFFYVWLKRSIGFLYPDLFSTPLTPKSSETIAELPLIRGMNKNDAKNKFASIKTKEFFENMLSKSFSEIRRVLKPNGITIIVYAHKSTEGWETLINSILESGLVITGAWPIHTEMPTRLSSQGTAALASSIYMIARKQKKIHIGFYRNIKQELKQHLNKRLEQLWNENIAGADFFISAIGSAVEVYGKYEKIVDDEDEKISVLRLLDDTRTIVTNYVINNFIEGEFSDKISPMTRFYILWRWAYGNTKVPFDDALKMAQSIGIDIEQEWNKGFIVKEKELIHILGPDERNEKNEEFHDLIDILHKTLLLWKKENTEKVDKFLEEQGYKNSQMFKSIAQAISELVPQESTEKKWLDGLLTRLKPHDSQSGTQGKLF